jgi:hypothetical protein
MNLAFSYFCSRSFPHTYFATPIIQIIEAYVKFWVVIIESGLNVFWVQLVTALISHPVITMIILAIFLPYVISIYVCAFDLRVGVELLEQHNENLANALEGLFINSRAAIETLFWNSGNLES